MIALAFSPSVYGQIRIVINKLSATRAVAVASRFPLSNEDGFVDSVHDSAEVENNFFNAGDSSNHMLNSKHW